MYGKKAMMADPKGSMTAMAAKGRKDGKAKMIKARKSASPAKGPCNAHPM